MRSVHSNNEISYEILNKIRTNRNLLIKAFLNENYLIQQIHSIFPGREVSAGKIQLTINDLMESLIAPVDTKRYETIIQMSNARQSNEIDFSSFEQLFLDEIISVIQKRVL